MKALRLVLAILVVTSVVSCTASGPLFREVHTANRDKSVIYIYHPRDDQYGNSEAHFLYYDDRKIFRFTHDGYTSFIVDPGVHKFQIYASVFGFSGYKRGSGIEVVTSEGSVHYVRYREVFSHSEFWSTGTMAGASRITRPEFAEILPETGGKEIASMRYLPANY